MDHYNFILSYSVRVADVNYGGHVANSAVLNFFQDARIAYLAHLGPYSELDIGHNCGIILPEAQIFYRQEMFLGDLLEIGVKVSALRNSAFVMEYRIEREGIVVAEGVTQLVTFDYHERRPRRLPPEFKAAVRQYENL